MKREPVVCHTCGKPIEDLGMAIVSWKSEPGVEIGGFKVTHKGRCDPGDHRAPQSLEATDLTYPEGYLNFIFGVVLAAVWAGQRLADYHELADVLEAFAPFVCRETTPEEKEQWGWHHALMMPIPRCAASAVAMPALQPRKERRREAV